MKINKKLGALVVFASASILGGYFGYVNNIGTQESVETGANEWPLVSAFVANNQTNQNPKNFATLKNFIAQTPGVYSVYIKDLITQEVFEYKSSLVFSAASLSKVLVATSTMKQVGLGNLSSDTPVMLLAHDIESGAGLLQYESIGTKYSVGQLLEFSLKKSDNTATNMLARVINKNYIDDDTFSLENTTTAKKVGAFYEKLYMHDYVTKEFVELLFDIMKKTDYDDRIYSGLNPYLVFSHKAGNWPNDLSWHDCGIVMGDKKDVVVCLMSSNAEFPDFLLVAQRVGEFVTSLYI